MENRLNPEAIPDSLKNIPQWVCWKYERRGNKETKIPYDAKGGAPASSTDADTWCSYQEAIEAYESDKYSGIGFVFSSSDHYCGVDLDACLDDGWLWGEELVRWLDTYAEISPSGCGVKLILQGKKADHARCVKRGMAPDNGGVIEIYDRARFFAITGQTLDSSPTEIADRQEQLDALCEFLWPRLGEPAIFPNKSRPMENDEIERRALAYLNALPAAISGQGGHNATFTAASALVHGFGISTERALELLKLHFNPRCEPTWSDKELQHKVDQAAKAAHERPAGWLRDSSQFAEPDDVDLSQFLSRTTSKEGVADPTDPCALVTRLSDVECVPLQWLWPGRIPLGKLTLLAGDPGLGKSFVTLDMASRVSRGNSWPDLPLLKQEPGSVVVFNAEDDLEDTIVPRLHRCEADVSKILAIEGIVRYDPKKNEPVQWFFCLESDLPHLERVIEQNPDTRLVVIDPVSAYCGHIDTHKNSEVRAMLAPLAALARRQRVAVLCITHLSKSVGSKAVYRSMGSLAFAAAARAVWTVVKDEDEPKRRLLLPAKLNLAQDPDGLAYSIVEGRVAWESDGVQMHADDAFAAEMNAANSRPRGAERREAKQWLSENLAGKKLASTEIIQLAKEFGFSEKTLRRAFSDLGGKPCKSEFEGGWFWELPGQPPFAA